MNSLYIGIDVSSRDNAVYFMKPDGAKHSSFTVQNNLNGAKIISQKVVSAMTTHNFDSVIFGLEATSVYGEHIVSFLREDFNVSKFNKKIHVLNARQVKKFKDSYSDLPKNDAVDAFVIADHLRFGRISKEVYSPMNEQDDYRYKAYRI